MLNGYFAHVCVYLFSSRPYYKHSILEKLYIFQGKNQMVTSEYFLWIFGCASVAVAVTIHEIKAKPVSRFYTVLSFTICSVRRCTRIIPSLRNATYKSFVRLCFNALDDGFGIRSNDFLNLLERRFRDAYKIKLICASRT